MSFNFVQHFAFFFFQVIQEKMHQLMCSEITNALQPVRLSYVVEPLVLVLSVTKMMLETRAFQSITGIHTDMHIWQLINCRYECKHVHLRGSASHMSSTCIALMFNCGVLIYGEFLHLLPTLFQ